MRRSWIVALAATSLFVTALGVVRVVRRSGGEANPATAGRTPSPIARLENAARPREREEASKPTEPPRVEGLDLDRIDESDGSVTAPAATGIVHLTLDPELQHTAKSLLALHHLPEAALVLMDVKTGRLLAYATHVEHGPLRDMCVEAVAPSASVFKIVTASALVEDAHLGADTTQCYSGGEQRITKLDLIDDPKRDRWCVTLAGAMGRSINTVFARLAERRLAPAQLEAMARRFGYGEPVPFDVPVQPSSLHVPTEPLEFARTAAGFWNTTLSPLQAVELSAIIARHGESVRPTIVDRTAARPNAVSSASVSAPLAVAGAGLLVAPDAGPTPPAASIAPSALVAPTRAMVSLVTSAPIDPSPALAASTTATAAPDDLAVSPRAGRRVMARETADQVLEMMERTTVEGTCRRAFHDGRGRAFLPGIDVAGKTGTLTDAEAQRYYTWFTGFAPARAEPDAEQVAVAVLVVNGPTWEVKANVVARDMLRAYFASKGAAGVTRPPTTTVARRRHER